MWKDACFTSEEQKLQLVRLWDDAERQVHEEHRAGRHYTAALLDGLLCAIDRLAGLEPGNAGGSEIEPSPAKQAAPTRPPAAAPAGEKGGHRHKFGADGRCTVKRDGQPCPDVRKRSRGDARVPTAGSPTVPPKVDPPSLPLPAPPRVRRHLNRGNVAACGAVLGALDVITLVGPDINCADCGALGGAL
jgi:hypothetical protein